MQLRELLKREYKDGYAMLSIFFFSFLFYFILIFLDKIPMEPMPNALKTFRKTRPHQVEAGPLRRKTPRRKVTQTDPTKKSPQDPPRQGLSPTPISRTISKPPKAPPDKNVRQPTYVVVCNSIQCANCSSYKEHS